MPPVSFEQRYAGPPRDATLLSGSAVDMDQLHEVVAWRGIDPLLQELRPGGRLATTTQGDGKAALETLLVALELEAHHLREWSSPAEPVYFLQQLRNRCFERGLWELQVRAEQALSAKGWPYLRERVRTDREVSGRIRTFEAAPDAPGRWRNKAVGGVALTPDGRLAVASFLDKAIQLWDLDTGRILRTLEGHTDEVRGVAVSGDGQQAISASIDRTLKVWDLETGRALRTLTGHTAGVWGVAVTPDGRSAVSASMDHTLKVWDLVTGEARLTLGGHRDSVLGAAVTPDGEKVVSASMDGTLRVWHLATGDMEHTLRGHRAGVWSVSISECGKWAVSGSSDRAVLVWDLARGEIVDTLTGHTADVTAVKWIGDAWAVSASLDGTVKIWDLSEARIGATWTGRGSGVSAIDVSRDRRRAVSGARDGALEVWSLTSAIERAVGRPPAPPVTPGAAGGGVLCDVAVSPGGRWALAVADDGSLKLQDLKGDTPLRSFAAHQASDERDVRDVRHARVSEDGSRGVTVSCDGTVTVWDLATGRNAVQVRCRGRSNQVGVSADTLRAVGPGLGGALQIWDLTSGQVVKEVPEAGMEAYYLLLSGDGRRAVTLFWGSVNNTCSVWDLTAGVKLRSFWAGNAPLGISEDGRLAVISTPSYNASDRVDVWDLDRGTKVCTALGRWKMAMSRDGAKIASADGDLVVTDARTGQRLARASSQAPFSCCAFTPDGRTLVAGDRAGAIHVVDEWPAGW